MIDLGINLFQEIAALGGGGGGYSISNSLRFNDNDSAYLSWTPSSAGNRKTWTWSGWVKRGNIGTSQFIFTANIAAGDESFEFTTSNTLRLRDGNSAVTLLETNALLRDPSGWYHIVLVYDSSNSTGAIYVNGVQQSLSTNNISLNRDSAINNNVQHRISGYVVISASYFDGYMAEVNFIDGQALTADDFGQIDATTGEWSPKAYSGTYGTNGFYLPFNGNANDDSGNGNNWTENNLASTDYMIDTPTNNFCTLNPLDTGGGSVTLSDGNLNYAIASSTGAQVRGTLGTGLSSKWYWEFTNGTTATPFTPVIFGISTLDGQITNNSTSLRLAAYIYTDGGINNVAALTVNGSTSSPIQTQFRSAAVSDVLQVAYDADTGKLWFGKNNVWYDAVDTTTGNPSAGLNPVFTMPTGSAMTPFLLNIGGSYSGFLNCGQRPFAYTPPTGYLALCTDNLPAPAIEQPETQFNVVTYTGDGNTGRTVTGVGFQPDFVWLKERNNAAAHFLYDSVRGATLGIHTNLTDAEATYTDGLTSFDTDGFTVGSRSNNNGLGDTYVAWCWKAGGTAVTNTDGVTSGVFTAVTSQVSANVDSGFSIQTYTAPASGKPSWGHGLGVTPKVLILKRRDGTGNWEFISPELIGASYGLRLNTTAAATNYTNNYAFFDSSKIDIGNATYNLTGSADYVAYTFAEVESFSKFGSYVGNGSADGPFIYTGFRPAFVLVKSSSLAGSYWHIMDAKRNEYNVADKLLYPNVADAEGTGLQKDFLSNGFKIRSTATWANGSGQTYIYMAFAEAPFKNAVAR